MTTSCLGCTQEGLDCLIDFGPQPPSNRFRRKGDPDATRHRLTVSQCGHCGLIQLVHPMPPEVVRSRYDWISYNEPEGHLDSLVAKIASECGLNSATRILGLTYKDDSTLARFNRLGWTHSTRLDPAADLDVRDPRASLETIQQAFGPGRVAELVTRHGQADLLIARHVLEHAHDPRRFLRACLAMIRPGGWLVLEMPDSTKFLGAADYSFIWEEHITYFTPATLGTLLRSAGCARIEVFGYPYALEDSLIALVRVGESAGDGPVQPEQPEAEIARGKAYAARFPLRTRGLRSYLEGLRAAGKRIAGFGAGHLAAKFVNLHGIADLLTCVVDDNPHKQGLLMPGSNLEIVGSTILADASIDLCLLSLSPESEARVLTAKRDYLDRGGEFRSMFSLSPLALPLSQAGAPV